MVVAAAFIALAAGLLATGSSAAPPSSEARTVASRAIWAQRVSCNVGTVGLIRNRWLELDAGEGPLGCPTAPERARENGARSQEFEHGEVVFSPRQGDRMIVAAYQRGKDLVVHWGSTEPFDYEVFFVSWQRDGKPVGYQKVEQGRSHDGTLIMKPAGNGGYAINVKGCYVRFLKGTLCRQGFTVPATVRFRHPSTGTFDGVTPPCRIQPGGLIGARWYMMGAERSPLGCPLTPEQVIPGRAGRRQTFQRGEMAWSPDQGKELIVTAYRLWNQAVFEWSVMDPFKYDYFRYDVTFNGVGQGQAAVKVSIPPGNQGRIWTRLQGFGTYGFTVKGCDKGGFLKKDKCRQGYTIPVRVRVRPYDEGVARCAAPADVLIASRWHELGAWDGPLGCPRESPITTSTGRLQLFEHGQIRTVPSLGSEMALAVYRQGRSIAVDWGLMARGQRSFNVRGHLGSSPVVDAFVEEQPLEWARPGGSGHFRFFPTKDGRYDFTVSPCGLRITDPCGDPSPAASVMFVRGHADALLNSAEVRSTSAQARERHGARTLAVARHLSCTRLLELGPREPSEDLGTLLLARLQRLQASGSSDDRCPGELPSFVLVNEALKDVVVRPVGTETDTPCGKVHGEYDTFLKGLVTAAYRFRGSLVGQTYDRILGSLFTMTGGHDGRIETKQFCGITGPESENHILLIETSRFLANQLLFQRTREARFDNYANELGDWLLRYLQRIARHDFLEYNARPYQRYSLNALLNLYDFAEQPRIRRAARILLDYSTTKFAISSNDLRRLGPFRRLREKVNTTSDPFNQLYSHENDPQTGFFLMYVGPETSWFPDHWTTEGLIAGLSSYRPPRAAYAFALHPERAQHRFFHGQRPRVRGSSDLAGGGVEIYSSSPSFLISAGGMFVNSGYGHDEFLGYKDVGAVQATTLLPTRGDLSYGDLIRFQPFPDFRTANNTCVHAGFACGVNLELPEKWAACSVKPESGSWIFFDLNASACGELGLYVAAYRGPVSAAAVLQGDGTGSIPSNVGFFHAIEADAMSFADFVARTRVANATMPKVDYGGTYEFRSADDHVFTFRVWPDGHNYKSRVATYDGSELQDQSALPLADGPFLRSRGHSGYIEIRHPRCARPLLLDYRNALVPAVGESSPCPA